MQAPNMRPKPRKRVLNGIMSLLGILALVAGYLWLRPLDIGELPQIAQPIDDYSEALQQIPSLDAAEAAKLAPYGRTQLLTHGHKTQNVIVFFHGYTSCPQQFSALGYRFYKLGYNVLIPRLPHHGLQDRLTDAQSRLTAEELTACGDKAIDIAHGLGDRVTVAGLSAGGIIAAWVAQHRSDIDKAVLIAPAFGYKAVPSLLTRAVMNVYRTLPNSYTWWDPKLKDKLQPEYLYPRYSTRALAELLRLSFAEQEEAAQSAPTAASLLVITNANDASVDNSRTAKVVADWRARVAGHVHTFEFPATLGLQHDLIDPTATGQRTALVYPKLIALIQR